MLDDGLIRLPRDLGIDCQQHPVGQHRDSQIADILWDDVVASLERCLDPCGAHQMNAAAGTCTEAELRVPAGGGHQAHDVVVDHGSDVDPLYRRDGPLHVGDICNGLDGGELIALGLCCEHRHLGLVAG